MTHDIPEFRNPTGAEQPAQQPQHGNQRPPVDYGHQGTLGRPRYSTRRILCGIWWALGTAICGISALISLFGGHFLQFLGAGAIAGLIGWYDYRIWTFKAKWLMFLIIF